MERREFLKKVLGIGIDLGVTGLVLSSSIVSCTSEISYNVEDDTTNPNPISICESQESKKHYPKFHGMLIQTEISKIPYKLFGVYHSRKFAQDNYKTLDELVKNASVVVSEGLPTDMNREVVTNDGKSYFGTLLDLCKKHNKSVLEMDSLSTPCVFIEGGIGIAGGLYAIDNSRKILGANSTRRDFFIEGTKTLAGLYLLMGSYSFSNGFKELFIPSNEDTEKQIIDSASREVLFLGHITDQRNVALTNRLAKLPQILNSKDLAKGEYILVNFGAAHVAGIDFYLKHPYLRKLKSLIYRITYDNLDSNAINIFTNINDCWHKKRLN